MYLEARDYVRTPEDDANDAANEQRKRRQLARMARDFERRKHSRSRFA